jgi:uncharacterized lipoprotein YehR (DUF1307 family)
MKKINTILVLLVMVMMFQGCGDEKTSASDSEKTDVDFTVLYNEQYGQYSATKTLKVITTQSDYEDELTKYITETAPAIDFDTYRVVLVDWGGIDLTTLILLKYHQFMRIKMEIYT